jgi:hypothetical protein
MHTKINRNKTENNQYATPRGGIFDRSENSRISKYSNWTHGVGEEIEFEEVIEVDARTSPRMCPRQTWTAERSLSTMLSTSCPHVLSFLLSGLSSSPGVSRPHCGTCPHSRNFGGCPRHCAPVHIGGCCPHYDSEGGTP